MYHQVILLIKENIRHITLTDTVSSSWGNLITVADADHLISYGWSGLRHNLFDILEVKHRDFHGDPFGTMHQPDGIATAAQQQSHF